MRNTGLALVATFDDGSSMSHPISDADSALKVFNWLSDLTQGATWSVEVGG